MDALRNDLLKKKHVECMCPRAEQAVSDQPLVFKVISEYVFFRHSTILPYQYVFAIVPDSLMKK